MRKLLILVLIGVIAMAHGAQDYSNVRKEEFTIRIDDMAELASRLTDLASIHRGGEVLFVEGFDNGIVRWDTTLSGTGAAFELDNQYTISGSYSARLTGGSNSAKSCYAHTELPYLVMSTFGVETRLSIGTNVDLIYISFIIFDGTTRQQASIKIDVTDKEISYRSDSGAYVVLATDIELSQEANAFNFVKFTVNGTDQEYKYLIINSNKWELTGYGVYSINSSSIPYISVGVTVYSVTGFNGFINIDNFFVTRNEY